MKEFTPLELPIYKSKFNSSYKQFDKYFLFIERSLELLKEGGYFGYIVPSKFAKVGAGKKLRELLVDDKAIQQIISFGANQVFQNKTTYTCLLILKKEKLEQVKYLEVNSLKNWKTRNIGSENFDEFNIDSLEVDGCVLYPSILKPIYTSIVSQSNTLEELIGSENIYNGIQTSANNVYIHSIEKKDKDNNIFTENVFSKNCKGSIIHGENRIIAAIGLEDIVVADTRDALLICKKSQTQDVKNMVAEIKKAGREENRQENKADRR